jgi:signal transduction histidine kinase
MKRGSIRLRLCSAAAISIVIALALAGVGLRYLFERHVERRIEADLNIDLNQLIGATTLTDGTLQVTGTITDPRFQNPISGYYWQVEGTPPGSLIRSRSLWDGKLALPPASGDGARYFQEIAGPDGRLLLVVDRTIIDANGQSFRASVAEDHATVEQSVSDYVRELAPALLLLAAVLIAAIFVQITIGLAPLEKLRVAVREVVARRTRRLGAASPSEVQPLADEIDRLLEAQEKALARARLRAADLAHGLKTPLQLLSGDIRTLREKGETQLADVIEKSATAIRRHVDRELARARVAPGMSRGGNALVADIAGRVIDVVRRTPEGERLAFVVDVPVGLTAAIDEGDLSEILGNLIENAARFAKSAIGVAATEAGGSATITVADDGPGISDEHKEAVLSRGVSLEGESRGDGLGLAIVSDIVEAYGGRLSLLDARPGLKVSIFLPAPV